MRKLKHAPVFVPLSRPSLGRRAEVSNIGPSKRVGRPAQRLCPRLPHGNHYWAYHQGRRVSAGGRHKIICFPRHLLPPGVEETEPDPPSWTPNIWSFTIKDVLH